MVTKKTPGSILFDVMNVIFLILLSLVTLYPFLYVVFASLSGASELGAHSGLMLRPAGFSTEAYRAVFQNKMIYIGYKNTLIYMLVGTGINLIMTAAGAYILSRKNFYWKNAMTAIIMFTMFFGGGLIPSYLLVRNLKMMNTIWAIVLPGAISTWNLIIMRTSFSSIPDSLEESAKIDGANDFYILFRIILPLSMPVIAVMILYYGVGHWNSWFNAMIYLKDKEKFPLQLVLREILIINNTDNMLGGVGASDKESVSETIKYATIMVATVPILCVYPFLQKYFVKGVMVGAIKG